MIKSDTISKVAFALVKAQSEMPVVERKTKNLFLSTKYADLGEVISTTRDVLAKYGLAISQLPTSDGARLGLTTMLIHESGEFFGDTIYTEVGEEKGKSMLQVLGSAMSYLRRYGWSAITGVYTDEDIDGNAGKQKQKMASEKSEEPSPLKAMRVELKAVYNGASDKQKARIEKLFPKYEPLTNNPSKIKDVTVLQNLLNDMKTITGEN